jgi:thiol-disulfide isomerase/thioredoxin
MEFYSPSCKTCIKFAPVWEKIAEDLSDVNDLLVAKMDGANNEI